MTCPLVGSPTQRDPHRSAAAGSSAAARLAHEAERLTAAGPASAYPPASGLRCATCCCRTAPAVTVNSFETLRNSRMISVWRRFPAPARSAPSSGLVETSRAPDRSDPASPLGLGLSARLRDGPPRARRWRACGRESRRTDGVGRRRRGADPADGTLGRERATGGEAAGRRGLRRSGGIPESNRAPEDLSWSSWEIEQSPRYG